MNPLLPLGTTDANRTQILQGVIHPLLRLGTTHADRTQTSRLPYFIHVLSCTRKCIRHFSPSKR